jgi:hypothetical protein
MSSCVARANIQDESTSFQGFQPLLAIAGNGSEIPNWHSSLGRGYPVIGRWGRRGKVEIHQCLGWVWPVLMDC